MSKFLLLCLLHCGHTATVLVVGTSNTMQRWSFLISDLLKLLLKIESLYKYYTECYGLAC